MGFGSDQIQSFRFWIQGYPNFYEPITEECFRVAGYRVLRRPALVGRADILRGVNAIANLADKAGTIRVSVEATHPEGFDPAWLRNAVLEPLEEADIEVEREKDEQI